MEALGLGTEPKQTISIGGLVNGRQEMVLIVESRVSPDPDF